MRFLVIITNKQLNMFGGTTRIRSIQVPDEEVRKCVNDYETLERIFFYGQNDFQPIKDCPSISIGDIAFIGVNQYVCEPFGWSLIKHFSA